MSATPATARALTHLSLFSGIGGIDLAATWAGFETVAFCERDAFCQRVLAHHWPGVPIYDAIESLDRATVAGLGPIDLLSGGFPCQPFSTAGKRLGTQDDRYLWPEMRRVIAAARPRWIVAENVAHIVRMALDDVLADLEDLDYTAGAVVLPACAVGAPHIQERCFIVAHTARSDGRAVGPRDRCPRRLETPAHCHPQPVANPSRLMGRARVRDLAHWESTLPPVGADGDAGARLGSRSRRGRVAHGLPSRLDRCRALGNAVVPQQIYPILSAIAVHLQTEEVDP
jgi:DNA (cytosine-5)-methyltransferase 1